ncbi:hypothetical protein BGZ82_011247 [Podila clonocystis]|nr:hypothetical protein BGZ82_011247 [Podila clonocystis]
MVFSVTVLIALSGVILTHFTTAAQQLGSPTTIMALSNQSVQLTAMFYLPTWTRVVPYGDDVTATLLSMINSPDNIPGMSTNTVYQAHLSEYKNLCNVASVYIETDKSTPVFTPEESCMKLSLSIMSAAIVDNMSLDSVHVRADGTANMTYYGPTLAGVFEFSSMAMLNFGSTNFSLIDQSNLILVLPSNGTSSPPSTMATKNWTKDGVMTILSMTTTRIYAGIESLHDALEAQFGNNELFSNVETSIQQSKFTPNATYNILFAELRLNGTMLEVASCMTGNLSFVSKLTIHCLHINLKAIVATSLQFNTSETWVYESSVSSLATIKHVPYPRNPTLLDTEGITNKVADLFGKLGCSVVMNWRLGVMVIYFDKQEIFNGFEVPTWLVYTLGPFLGILLIVALWTFKFEDKYTSSFLDLVHSVFVFKLETKTQSRLVSSNVKHGVQLGDGHLAFEEDSLVKVSEEQRYESTTILGCYQMVPGQSGAAAPFARGTANLTSSSSNNY